MKCAGCDPRKFSGNEGRDDAVALTEIPYLNHYRAWRRRDNWPVAVCGSTEEAILRLQALGYEQVSVFPNGNSLWKQARPETE